VNIVAVMAGEAYSDIPPSAFKGNFGGYVEAIQAELESRYGEDAGSYESVSDRAGIEAQYVAARNWLVERWGDHFPCPVCRNEEWTVSGVGPSLRPAGFLNFHVTCGYCGNTMQVVPGNAQLDAPQRANQLQLRDQ
jgi:hypothetical protein